jgi:GTP-binding protein Era
MRKRSPADGGEGVGEAAFRCGEVAIVGRPNVGKSTLLNALVGARLSITSRKAQTTRHRLLGILTTAQAQFLFVDTPGFQTKHHSVLNERMNRTVRTSIHGVDVVTLVLEAGRLGPADHEVLALLPRDVPVVAAVNKLDRLKERDRVLPFIAELAAVRDFAAIVPVSAEKGWQLDALLGEIAKQLPVRDAVHPEEALTDRDERFLAAEYIREKIFRLLGQEVPYATSVAIDSFEHKAGLRSIHATVYVDKASQRAMLLGAGGERMKGIAASARRDMEQLFGGKVFLEVWVKVKSGWATDERMLSQFGY